MSKSTKAITNALQSIALSSLPKLGAALDEGTFQGVITTNDGTHAAVILLNTKPSKRLLWEDAKAWAESIGGQLPSRPVSALLYANAKPLFQRTWYWTSDELQTDTGDEDDASYAWRCNFDLGFQFSYRKSAEGAAVAVRLIPLSN